MQKLELEDVSSVPVLPVIQKLPGWREMLKTLTPEGDEVPFGWEVLSTAEFLFLLTEPVIAQQLTAARGGTCPTDAIYRVLVPLLQVRLPHASRHSLDRVVFVYLAHAAVC